MLIQSVFEHCVVITLGYLVVLHVYLFCIHMARLKSDVRLQLISKTLILRPLT